MAKRWSFRIPVMTQSDMEEIYGMDDNHFDPFFGGPSQVEDNSDAPQGNVDHVTGEEHKGDDTNGEEDNIADEEVGDDTIADEEIGDDNIGDEEIGDDNIADEEVGDGDDTIVDDEIVLLQTIQQVINKLH
ncbi:hypothetical protein R6Q59_036426 [Mikania micrantha]